MCGMLAWSKRSSKQLFSAEEGGTEMIERELDILCNLCLMIGVFLGYLVFKFLHSIDPLIIKMLDNFSKRIQEFK